LFDHPQDQDDRAFPGMIDHRERLPHRLQVDRPRQVLGQLDAQFPLPIVYGFNQRFHVRQTLRVLSANGLQTVLRTSLQVIIVVFASLILLSSDAFSQAGSKLKAVQSEKPNDRSILQRWTGDYPVAQLDRLPAGQRESRVGYIGDAETFASVWQVLKPGTALPQVDFSKNLVVFVRNVKLYHNTLIVKVTLKDGVAEIVAAGSMTPAGPIKDRVEMGLAVISREGLKFIQTDNKQIPVR
jgi:hypothetical protein